MSDSDDQRQICAMLARLEPGFLPREIFHAVARLVVTPTFVVAPLLMRNSRLMVLLRGREADDPHYPSLLHTPGTVLLSTDESLPAAYRRLMATELPGIRVKQGPVFVEAVFDRIARGREISLIHWIELEDIEPGADFFDVSDLPENLIATEYPRIEQAAAHFRARHSGPLS